METTSSPILTPIRVIWVLTRGSLIDQILSILKSTQDQSNQGNKNPILKQNAAPVFLKFATHISVWQICRCILDSAGANTS